mgnify:CR=1 FL=1
MMSDMEKLKAKPRQSQHSRRERSDRAMLDVAVDLIAAKGLSSISLAEVGITCTHAPVLDVRQPGAHDVIGDRALGHEPLRVAALGRAVLEGLAAAGVVGTIKHMPGHGRAGADSHKELPTVTASAQDLEVDIAPFRALNHAPIAMSAHICFTAWDQDHPATQSLMAYLDGINQYQATHKAPLEFDILHIPKRPFTPEDTIAVSGYLAYSFAAAFKTEPLMTL